MRVATPRLFAFVLFASIFLIATRAIGDPDFWWHLRTGQLILETGDIPHQDVFSYTKAGAPWVAHEWLSEVALYLLFRAGGNQLLIGAFAALITAAFWLTYLRCAGRPYFAGFAILLGALATAPVWGVRPQIFTLVLGSLFMLLIERHLEGREIRPLLFLPVLTILWVNLHSGYALGLAILAGYAAGTAFEIPLRRLRGTADAEADRNDKRSVLILLAVLAASGLLVMINPNGARMYAYPFETLTSGAMQAHIQEWFSPNFHLPRWQPFAWLLFLTMAAALISGAGASVPRILLAALFGYAALRSARNIPFFVLAVVPILSGQLSSLLARLIPSEPGPPSALAGRLNAILLIVVAAAALLQIQVTAANQTSYEADRFPARAVEWLQDSGLKGNVFNTYDWGGYLIWKLYPDVRVYIDGRADVYGDEFIQSYLDAYQADPDWPSRLARSGTDIVFVKSGSALSAAVERSPEWKEIYHDDMAAIFSRR